MAFGLGASVFLSACVVPNEDVLLNNVDQMTGGIACNDAIKQYLDSADMEGAGAGIDVGHNVVVHYVGRLDDQKVFDTSVESIAKACGMYNAMRDYNEGLAFEVGAGQMIAGFDQGVLGMKKGQTKTITIPASEAYGEWSEDALITVERTQIPNGDQLEVGMPVMNAYKQTLLVHSVTETEVVLDANHELAGKNLIFDITVIEIK